MNLTMSKEQSAVTGATPRVDLLPIEVRRRKGQKQTRSLLIVAVGAVVVLAVGATLAANVSSLASSARLDAANANTIALKKLEAKYSEVPTVLGQIALEKDGVTKATAVEVQWAPFLTEVTTSLPAGYVVTDLAANGFSVVNAPAIDPKTLATVDVVKINFTATGNSLPVVADWLTALQKVTGYSSAWINNVKVDKGVYTVDATLNVNGTALSSPDRAYMDTSADKGK